MAPGLISQFKHFSFLTPPSFLTFKDKKNSMKKKICIWKRGLQISASRLRTGQESYGPIIYMFSTSSSFSKNFDFKNET